MFYKKFFIGFLAVALMIAIAVMLNMGLNTENKSPVVELNTGVEVQAQTNSSFGIRIGTGNSGVVVRYQYHHQIKLIK